MEGLPPLLGDTAVQHHCTTLMTLHVCNYNPSFDFALRLSMLLIVCHPSSFAHGSLYFVMCGTTSLLQHEEMSGVCRDFLPHC